MPRWEGGRGKEDRVGRGKIGPRIGGGADRARHGAASIGGRGYLWWNLRII